MNGTMVIQGRSIGQAEIDLIRGLLAAHEDWHRTRLSRELCRAWAWCNPAGRPKDMACRSLLLKLEERGLIRLPARRKPPVNAYRYRRAPKVAHARDPIEAPLRELMPLDMGVIGSAGEDLALFGSLIDEHHYLGLRNTAGENVKYLVRDRRGRPLCCLWFAAAAWRCRARDEFIGWEEDARKRNLPWVANNTRFLVLPWVRVKNLASHLLGAVTRRIVQDWDRKYGHGLWALETFVDSERFTGACYRAANWRRVGQTTGRTRNDVVNRGPLSTVKDVYVYPLAADFRRALCGPPGAGTIEATER